MEFVVEISTYHLNRNEMILSVNWPWVERVHFTDGLISHTTYEVSEWDWRWWLQRSQFCEWIL